MAENKTMVEGMDESIKRTEKGIKSLAEELNKAGVPEKIEEISKALMACADASSQFEEGVAKIMTATNNSVLGAESMKAAILDLSNETGRSAGVLSEAMYQAVSASISTADAIGVVETAAKLSVGGFTDESKAIDILTTTLNAYGLEADQTSRISDVLVAAQNRGKMSVGELAGSMEKVIPLAAACNVNIENLGAAYAGLTSKGYKTEEATNQVKAALSELSESGSLVGQILQEQTGKTFADLMSGGMSLGDVLQLLSDSVNNDAQAFQGLWSNTEAGVGMLALVNDGAAAFNGTLAELENSAGTTDAAFQTMAETSEFAKSQFENSAENLKIAIGDQLQPALGNLREAGAEAFDWAAEVVENNPWIVGAITGLTTAMTTLVAGAVGIEVVTTLMSALNMTLASCPALLIASAVIGLGAALVTLGSQMQGTSSESQKLLAETETLSKQAKELRKSVEESKAAFDGSKASTEAQYGAYQLMADRLYTLDAALKNTNLTEAEAKKTKSEMKYLIDELNSAMPGLNLQINEQNGYLEQGKEITDKYIESLKQKALVSAMEEELTTYYKQQGEALLQVEKATIQKNQAIQESKTVTEKAIAASDAYNEMQMLMNDLNKMGTMSNEDLAAALEEIAKRYNITVDEMQNGSNALESAAQKTNEYDQIIRASNKTIEKQDELVAGLTEDIDLTTEATNNLKEEYGLLDEQAEVLTGTVTEQGVVVEENAEKVKSAAELMKEKYDELTESIRGNVESSISALNEFSGGTEITAEEMRNNLDSQIEGLTTWKDNLITLSQAAGQGMSEELLNKLIEMGPEGANAVQAMVEALAEDEELFRELSEKYSEAFKLDEEIAEEVANAAYSLETGVSDMNSTLGNIDLTGPAASFFELSNAVSNAMEPAVGMTRDMFLNAVQNAQQAGIDIPIGIAEGITNGSISVSEATAYINGLLGLESANQNANQEGKAYTTATAAGIKDGAGAVSDAVGAIAEGASGIVAEYSDSYFNNGRNLLIATSQGMRSVQQNVVDAASAPVSAAVNGVSQYTERFTGLGLSISRGLATGIRNGASGAITAAVKVAADAYAAAKKELDINSPSKKFRALGQACGIGMVDGISSQKNDVSECVKDMAKTSVDTMKKSAKGMMRGLNKEIRESTKETRKNSKEYYKNAMAAARNYLNDKKANSNVSLKEEEDYWKRVMGKFKENSRGYVAAQKELTKAKANTLKQSLADMEANFSHEKALDNVKLADEVAFWKKYLKTTKSGTAERIKAQENLHKAEKTLREKMNALEETYENKTLEINDNLIASAKELTKEYNESVADRQKAIMGSMNLFDEYTKEKFDGSELLYNLATQVKGIKEWSDTLNSLEKRGLSGTLLKDLQEMGPSAAGELEALNSLTAQQLKEYVQLWEEKSALAKVRAIEENAGLLAEKNEKITDLTAKANEDIKAAAKELVDAAKELGVTATASIVTVFADSVKASSAELTNGGQALMQNIIDGVKSKREELEKEMAEIERLAEEAAKKAQDIAAKQAKEQAGIITSSLLSDYGSSTINAVNSLGEGSAVYEENTTNNTINVGGISITAPSVDMENIDEIVQLINQKLGDLIG